MAECRGLRGVDRLMEDDMQFGVSEGYIDINAKVMSTDMRGIWYYSGIINVVSCDHQ